jgi:eukaryotic-like serine/threonine-protein kinase
MNDDWQRRGPLSVTPAAEGQTSGEETPAGPAEWAETASRAVPRYRILSPLGIGGMGVVYRAEDTRLRRPVALKFLPPTLTPHPRAKERFLNEARAAAALDHPNICTVYEIGETAEGQLYIAMALYEGETLKRRLERGPLPVAEALSIALQVARGLARAHRRGIVHRDIKPANLMMTSDGVAKILDFGIARLPGQTLSDPLLGTPSYMSPEQERMGEVDARSDVWSLGVVLHEMLTGRLPGRGGRDEPSAEEEPPRITGQKIPPGIDRLLSQMLAPQPADRYPDAGALLADLAALEGATPCVEEVRAPASPRWRLAAGAAALAVLALASGGWFLWHRHRLGAPPNPSQATLTQLTDLPGKEWSPSLSPNGEFVYARKVSGRSRLFSQRVEGSNPRDLLGDSSQDDSQPAFSPDGQLIAFRSERDGGGIFLMGATGESVSRLTDFGFNPAWSPDGKEILFATDRVENPRVRRGIPSKIYRVRLDTRKPQLVHEGDAVQPSWSPNGLRIAYWGVSPSGERVIWTIPAAGGEAVQVTKGESTDWDPVWSPDGRYLYFASDGRGVTNLWRVPIDERSGLAGEPEAVTTSAVASMLLSFSQDGKRIVYSSDDSRTIFEKIAFDRASGATLGPTEEILETTQMIRTVDASRDGRWLVYQTSVPRENLVIIHPEGTGRLQLTSGGSNDRQPRWSPDGSRLSFYSNRSGKYEIWTIRADGSQLERVTAIPKRSVVHPIWSPDGSRLACDLGENEALIDLTRPLADRRPQFLPPANGGLGFSASSWSADGNWLAGSLHLNHPDQRQLPGIVLYSLKERTYLRLTDQGEGPTWLSDSRHLLYSEADGTKIFLLDTLSRTSRPVLTAPRGAKYEDFTLSPDDRTLYLARNTEEGAIWLLTLK